MVVITKKKIATVLTEALMAELPEYYFFPYYGIGIDAETEIERLIKQHDKPVVMIQAGNVVEDTLSLSTLGCIQTGNVMLTSFAVKPVDAIDAMLQLIALGYFDEATQQFTARVPAPFQVGTLQVYEWRPVGGIDETAETFGNIYYMDQLLRMQFQAT